MYKFFTSLLNHVENLPLVVSKDENSNVIKVYYLNDDLHYEIDLFPCKIWP